MGKHFSSFPGYNTIVISFFSFHTIPSEGIQNLQVNLSVKCISKIGIKYELRCSGFCNSHTQNVLIYFCESVHYSEAVSRRCSVKKLYLKISQNPQENTCGRVSLLMEILAQVVSCELCEIFRNTYFYRTPPEAASDYWFFTRIYFLD